MNTILIIILYIINIIINGLLYKGMIKNDSDYYPNPMALLIIFFSLFGTLILGIIYLSEANYTSKFLDYLFKPKNND